MAGSIFFKRRKRNVSGVLLVVLGTIALPAFAVTGIPGKAAKPKTKQGNSLKVDVHVFGTDDRVRVDTSEYPWRAIGYLETKLNSGKTYGCTATLVGRKHVLTAAHCVNYVNGSIGSVTFYPNFRGGKSKYSSLAVLAWTGSGSREKNDAYSYQESDWAILELEEPLGEKLGWLGVREIPVSQFPGTPIGIVGYSRDFENGKTGSFSSCRVQDALDSGVIRYDCDTMPGNSGGPVFTQEASGEYYVVAVNTSQTQSSPRTVAPGVNAGLGDNGAANFGISVRDALENLRSLD